MKNIVTITSKGQTTIPAPLRRKLGLSGNTGGVLDIRYDESKGQLIISKPLGLDALSDKLSSYIKPGVKPLIDADSYYQVHRAINNWNV